MLDVDDWADSINFQWNDVEAANDTGVADSRSQSNELEAVDNQSPNSARTKKQLTVDINAASGKHIYRMLTIRPISHRRLVRTGFDSLSALCRLI